MLAEYCGAALHLEQKHKELSLVNEVVREMNKTNDLASIYQMIVSHGVEILGCKGVSIMIVEKIKK